MIGPRRPSEHDRQHRAAARGGAELEVPAQVPDSLADVLQPGSPRGVGRVKAPAVVRDAHGQRTVMVVQGDDHASAVTGVLDRVLNRLGACEVGRLLGFAGAARCTPLHRHVGCGARGSGEQGVADAALGERPGVDPIGDFAQGLERCKCVFGQRGEGLGHRGRRRRGFLGELEPEQERNELALDSVMQIAFPATPFARPGDPVVGPRRRPVRLSVGAGARARAGKAGFDAGAVDRVGEFGYARLGRDRPPPDSKRTVELWLCLSACVCQRVCTDAPHLPVDCIAHDGCGGAACHGRGVIFTRVIDAHPGETGLLGEHG